jgi:hypothetical protein
VPLLPLALLIAFRLSPDSTDVQYKQPQLAVSEKLVGVTFGSGNAIYFSSSTDQGKTFSKPVKVAEPGVMSLGMHRGPRIAISASAIVISAVAGKEGKGKDGDLLAWRSTDNGVTWSSGVKVNDVPGSAREGLHTMASGGGEKNILYAAWLDLRSKGTKLYGAVSTDGGAHWGENLLVYESPDGTICQCCHPSATIGPLGDIYVMWRNALGGSRDMYIGRSTDNGKTYRTAKLGHDTWKLDACPMDGGALALDSRARIKSVWRREDTVFHAVPGGQEIALGKGKNASITYSVNGPYIAWSEGANLMLRTPTQKEPKVLAEGAYINLAGSGPVYAAWEDKGAIQLQLLP